MLDRILEERRAALMEAKRKRPLSTLIQCVLEAAEPRPFATHLQRSDRMAIIAEIKLRSPSFGVLRATRDVAAIAHQYAVNGADALSVLTEPVFFGGDLAFIAEAKSACPLPVLRKDFLFDPYQIYESRAAGADAVLLIAGVLSNERLVELSSLAADLGMASLIEVHDRGDLVKLRGSRAALIGVNHRNLKTLQIDPDVSARLFPLLPSDSIKVAESGISSAMQLQRMRELGANAALIGTSLMRRPSPGEALKELVASCG